MLWRLQTQGVTPEEAGLCGCWQFLAVGWERNELRRGKVSSESEEYSFYATSAAPGRSSAQQGWQTMGDPWSAAENGTHYRREVSLEEDACRMGGRTGAFVMATLRNLRSGLFELQQHPRPNQGPPLPRLAAQANPYARTPTDHWKIMNSG